MATGNGDRAAFTELYEYFAPRIKTLMLRIGFSDTEAEHFAQEALMNVWRNAKKFTPGTAQGDIWRGHRPVRCVG